MTPQQHTAQIAGHAIVWHDAPHEGTPTIYVHGVPDEGTMWAPFLERSGGIAVDLPGFGRSSKRADLDFSIEGYADFLEGFADHLGLARHNLVVHDWGVVGLAYAQRRPEAIERLAVIDAVPLLPGFRWHRIARGWRTRGVGEAMMGATTAVTMRLSSGRDAATVERVMSHFDQGTQRAILRLYRSAPPDVLAAAGARLGELHAPALVIWGADDPYIPTQFAEAYAAALPDARLEVLPDAGHWCWEERPDVVDTVATFLAGA